MVINKLKNIIKNNFQKLLDLKNLSTALFGVIVVLVSWSGSKVIQSNYELEQQITNMRQQNQVQSLENNNLKLKNQYLNTNEFLELSAREHFNKGLPGESLVLVPSAVALAHSAPAVPAAINAKSAQNRPWYERNFNAWLDFLFHRNGASS